MHIAKRANGYDFNYREELMLSKGEIRACDHLLVEV